MIYIAPIHSDIRGHYLERVR